MPPPVQNFIQRLIVGLVALDPLHEVLNGVLCVAVDVVWAAKFDLLKQEKQLEAFCTLIIHPDDCLQPAC